MNSSAPKPVSAEERERFQRRMAMLAEGESLDHGTPEWQESTIAWLNEERAREGTPPLKRWWEDKGEVEFYERARALGLLRRGAPAPR